MHVYVEAFPSRAMFDIAECCLVCRLVQSILERLRYMMWLCCNHGL